MYNIARDIITPPPLRDYVYNTCIIVYTSLTIRRDLFSRYWSACVISRNRDRKWQKSLFHHERRIYYCFVIAEIGNTEYHLISFWVYTAKNSSRILKMFASYVSQSKVFYLTWLIYLSPYLMMTLWKLTTPYHGIVDQLKKT